MSEFHWSRLTRRLTVLIQVVGYLTLFLGGVFALSALFQDELSSARNRQLDMALKYALSGAGLLLFHFLLFVLPHRLKIRKSPTHQRRRAQSRNYVSPTPRDTRRGGVLILTLALLSLLTLLLVQAQALARSRLRAEETQQASAALRRAATEAVWAALQRLADDPDLTVDTTNETWAAREEVTSPLGISTMTTVADATRRFDLNNITLPANKGRRSPEDILMDMMTLCGDFTPVGKVSALRDFTDAVPGGLYEADHYAKRVPPEACPDRGLYAWGELLTVEGWTRAAFTRKARSGSLRSFDADLVDCLTLLPLPRTQPLPVNINTASRETLTGVLGLGQDTLVATILTLRGLKPIRDLEPLSVMAEPGVFESVRPYLAVGSGYFEIESQAFADGRTERVRALAARNQEGRVDVVQWQF